MTVTIMHKWRLALGIGLILAFIGRPLWQLISFIVADLKTRRRLIALFVRGLNLLSDPIKLMSPRVCGTTSLMRQSQLRGDACQPLSERWLQLLLNQPKKGV